VAEGAPSPCLPGAEGAASPCREVVAASGTGRAGGVGVEATGGD